MSTVDDDQIEQLRRLWDRYGRLLLAVAVLLLGGVLGWQAYDGHRQRQAAAAAALYAAYLQPPVGQSAEALANRLRTEYPRSSYATFATFAEAKQAVEADKLGAAEQHLRWVVENAAEPADRTLARVRLARVLLDEGKPQAAQAVLDGETASSSPAVAELRGDIARAQGQAPQARQAYQEALAGLPAESGTAALIKLKLDAVSQP